MPMTTKARVRMGEKRWIRACDRCKRADIHERWIDEPLHGDSFEIPPDPSWRCEECDGTSWSPLKVDLADLQPALDAFRELAGEVGLFTMETIDVGELS
jgi:hypothetical protein